METFVKLALVPVHDWERMLKTSGMQPHGEIKEVSIPGGNGNTEKKEKGHTSDLDVTQTHKGDSVVPAVTDQNPQNPGGEGRDSSGGRLKVKMPPGKRLELKQKRKLERIMRLDQKVKKMNKTRVNFGKKQRLFVS